MANPADRHFELVNEQRALERLRQAVDVLERAKVPYTVEGGWAVAAYDSPVPSVDLDVLVDGDLKPDISERIEAATGIQIHAQAAQDALGIDINDSRRPNGLLGTDLSYIPHDLLEGHVQRLPVKLLDGLRLPVPEPAQLAFMKLKAFHDRRLQWEASRERYLLAQFPHDIRERTIRAGEGYWLRKSGKDLFDIAVLVQNHTTLAAAQAVTSKPIWDRLQRSLTKVPAPIQQFSTSMMETAGVTLKLPAFDAVES